MVVALGMYTEHWGLVKHAFPGIHNCCIDVTRAFRRDSDDDPRGSGFDLHTRIRIMAKSTWPVVWEVAMCVLRKFGILIVLCNHGRHRSLSLAYELAVWTGCRLVSMRDHDRPSRMRHPDDVLRIITPRLVQHLDAFGGHPHPVAGIHVCRYGFDGTAWAANENYDAPPTRYRHLDMTSGDILIESRCRGEASMEWGFGILVIDGAAGPTGWYPPSYVDPLDRWYFDGIENLYASLMIFQPDQRSDPAPQAHRGDWERTCVVCHSAYFGSGRCSNEPLCPRGRRRRWSETTLIAARCEWARIVEARNVVST